MNSLTIFLNVISDSIKSIHVNLFVLFKAIFIPVVFIFLLNAYERNEEQKLLNFAVLFVWLLCNLFVAIVTHRVVILGKDSVSNWGITRWTIRETYFLAYTIGLGILVVPFVLLGLIPKIGSYIAIALMGWFAARLSLVFPMIAVDGYGSFKQAWVLSQAHQVLIILVVIAYPVFLSLVFYPMGLIPGIGDLIASLFDTLIVIFEIAALSCAYKKITSQYSFM